MRRHLTTKPGPSLPLAARLDPALAGWLARLLLFVLAAVLLLTLVYQVPVKHVVDVGGFDAAYVQGFYDPEISGAPALAGSDGSARWTRDVSYLLFPQAGAPAQVTLRLRGSSAASPAPELIVLLNGAHELGRLRPGAAWEEHTFTIENGLFKPNDVVIELRAQAAPLAPDDPRPVGVLVDQATYQVDVFPVLPYPPQLAYGALAAAMLYLLRRPAADDRLPRVKPRVWWPALGGWWPALAALVALSLLFLLLYRAQPLYPYPLRWLLPALDAGLATLLALRYGPALARRAPWLADGAAIGGVGLWFAAILATAQRHVTLSRPGVENDFLVFATRSNALGSLLGSDGPETVLRADGFYNLGYPLLLWLARPVALDSPFLAARLIAALSAALFLIASWWLARRLLGRGPALLALAALALSPLVVEYGLYLGTDMPFAACITLALALLIGRPAHTQLASGRKTELVLAGLAAGAAFLLRHPGLLLLPFGWLMLTIQNDQFRIQHAKSLNALVFSLAFLVAIAPQLTVNLAETGQPLYSQQAKNIWMCVYADCDWQRWDEASNDVRLRDVLLRDPGRTFASWWGNVRGFFGSGGEDTSEFGRAIQLRLLGFPANWLAIAGLLGWLVLAVRGRGTGDRRRETGDGRRETGDGRRETGDGRPETGDGRVVAWGRASLLAGLLAWIALYVAAISVGLSLPRFFLPLVPIYALAAAWTVAWLAQRSQGDHTRRALLLGIALLALLWGGFATGTRYVLDNQPADEVAAVALVQRTLGPGDRLIIDAPPASALDRFSAIAHLAAPALHADGRATYLLRSGPAAVGDGALTPVGQAGAFWLYRNE